MSNEVFSSPVLSFRVFQNTTGAFQCEGHYQGIQVLAAMPINDNSKCVILLDPTANKEPRFENLLCVARDGSVVWRAELPESDGAVVSFKITEAGLFANTWSGYYVQINGSNGKIIEREFVK
jgi:hypothetical protein